MPNPARITVLPLCPRRIGDAQPRPELLAVIVRDPADQRNPQRLQCQVRRILQLAAARSSEQPYVV